MPKIVLLGAPGAGKSTHAASIAKAFDIPSIATGDILRENVNEGTVYGKQAEEYIETGNLVPDELIIAIVMDRIRSNGAEKGFLLDGFPRTIAQGETLDEELAKDGEALDYVLFLDAPEKIFIKRIANRRLCPSCGASFRLEDAPDEICQICGTKLIQRKDDDSTTVKNRIEVFKEQTAPLIEYYRKKGVLIEFDASPDAGTVQVEIDKVLGIE